MSSGQVEGGKAASKMAGPAAPNLFAVEQFYLGAGDRRLLAEIATKVLPQFADLVSGVKTSLGASVPAQVLELWETQMAQKGPRFLDALKRGDLAQYMDLSKALGKALAEAKVAFQQFDEMFRAYEMALLPLLVKLYREPERLKMAIEARQRAAHVYTAAAAQAYAEVYETTISRLAEELSLAHPGTVDEGEGPPGPPREIPAAGRPFEAAMELFGSPHTVGILAFLGERPARRFTEIQLGLGVRPKTLTARLHHLQEHGLVERHSYPEIPPRVEYALTDRAQRLLPIFGTLEAWHRVYGRA